MAFFQVAGDLSLTDNGREIQLIDGRDALLTSLKNGAQIFRSFWRYDRLKGLPYFDDILIKGPEEAVVQAAFRDYILDTPGITTITDLVLTFDRPAGILTVRWKAIAEGLGEVSDTFEYALADLGGTI